MQEVILFILSFIISTVASIVGLGGGVFYVPLLVLGFGMETQKAVSTSLLAMSFTTVSATLAYAKQRRINYKVGVLLDLLDVPGSMVGVYLTTIVDSKTLACLFGAFLLIISFQLFRKVGKLGEVLEMETKTGKLTVKIVYLALFASFTSGVVAGMLGAGGGTVDETIMVLGMGMPVKVAAATSVFGMALTNTAAVILHFQVGNIVPLNYAIPIVAGGLCGSQLGPRISRKLEEEILRKILATVFVLIALRMIAVPFI
ncbi:sulfite exporter TauE/SafE family protein [Candidatus Bathyarchaeota archaeon]|nr:sulfite exporter TauE/SafE family protein [Candidatus Bathyarchaeota archaeon]MBS7613044.1 sulfite exporter TauE/SafE family protein [Candidatus Bathyarchaeota archaeon]